jgi:peptide/nickel transport system ATP-binding protein
MIAIALAAGPQLLIADEPTTALDATLQREVLALLLTLVREDGMGLLLISHDLGVMADSVAQLAVMYAGRIVEAGTTDTVFARRAHPYTRGLHAARPRLGARRALQAAGVAQRLATIPGRVPALHALGAGCAFAPRCSRAQPDCQAEVPPLSPVLSPVPSRMPSPVPSAGPTHRAACLHPWPADTETAAA